MNTQFKTAQRQIAPPVWKRVFRYRELFLFLLPAITLIAVFNYVPMRGIVMAFKDFSPARGIADSPWVGLAHFQRMFNLPTFQRSLVNTLTVSLLTLALTFPLPVVLAILLNQIRSNRFRQVLQTATYLPHFISIVVVVGMISVFLSPSTGLYGNIARALGSTPIDLLSRARNFPWVYAISDGWQHTGWNAIIYIAALSTVDPQLYEAAVIDGASRIQRIVHIELPALAPPMVILLILSTGRILVVGFEKAYLLQNPPNLPRSEILSTYVYKVGLISAQFSFSTAVNLFNTLVSFIVLLLVNWIARRLSETSLL